MSVLVAELRVAAAVGGDRGLQPPVVALKSGLKWAPRLVALQRPAYDHLGQQQPVAQPAMKMTSDSR
jgi:hypothetical protein